MTPILGEDDRPPTDDYYGLSLPFDSDHPEFTRGFEAGFVYLMAKMTDEPFDVFLHNTNEEMARRVARATKRTCEIERDEDRVHMVVHYHAVG